MAVKFRAVATAINPDGTDAGSVTVTKPTGTADGDVLIAVTHGFTTDSFTPPAGWSFIGVFDDSTGLRSRAYKKIAASEGASYTFTFTGGSGGSCGASVAAFAGGYDVTAWSVRITSTTDPAEGYDLDAATDAVGWQVYCWRNSTANTTVTWTTGSEKHDITANNSSGIRRGQSGAYYGPDATTDIINGGDSFPGDVANPVQAPTFGIFWTFLVGDVEPDNETWSSTNGDFAIELKMDDVALTSTGDVTTPFVRDITSEVSAFAATAETSAASNAADGLESTSWLDSATAAPQWLRYDFGSTKTAKRYRLTSSASSSTRDPMNWTLEGSQNASSWTTLDTRTNQAFGNRGETREFRITTPGAYRYYRINVSANFSSGSTVGCEIAEFRLSTVDVWEDITEYAQESEKIRITRGLQGTSGRADFSRAYFTLNNTDGRFSLRNPDGAYHGAIGRNTQTRISKAYGTKALQLQGAVAVAGGDVIGDSVRCPIDNDLTVEGDIDIRIDLELDSWRAEQMLCGVAAPDTIHSWTLYLDSDGRLNFSWRPSGGSTVTARSTEAVPQTTRQTVRVTLDVNNGASGNTATFYTASAIGGSFTQLGDTVTNTGTTTIGYRGGALCVGHVAGQSQRGLHGLVYNFELRTGIAGTLVSDVDFTALTNGAHTFAESGNNWLTVANAVVSNRRYRFHGEVAEWPLAWDITGTWVYIDITAAGVQKRLERGSATGSVMYRQHTRGIISSPGFDFDRNTAYAYWPMEDGKNSFRIASALTGKPPLEIYGSPVFEDFSDFNESDPLPKLNSSKLGGRVVGNPTGYAEARFLLAAPDGISVGSNIISLYTSGLITKWEIDYEAANTWRVRGYTESGLETGTASYTQSGISVLTAGELMHVRIRLTDQLASTLFQLDVVSVAGESLGTQSSTFVGASPLGRLYKIFINDDDAAQMTDVYMGHVAVYGTSSPTFEDPINAWHYERAADRIGRICDEEEIEFRLVGDASTSTFLGYQAVGTPQSVLSAAAVADTGYLTDPLDALGIEYRTGKSLYNQAAHLTLSYTTGELSGELRPVGDDSYLTNDFTASRSGAGSARFRLTEGDLSVPVVGEYSDTQSFSIAHEGQCVDLASWFVHQGTLDEEYYNRIEVALENLRITASSTLTESILALDIGKRVDITDTPDFLAADDIRQIVIGYEEWFDNFQHNFRLNTIPERTFEVAQYDTDYRFDTAGSEVYSDITAAATSIPVSVTSGQPWSTTAADFDVWVDGERMTVTAVADNTTSDTSDTFNRADSTTNLASTDGGVVQAWVQDSGTWGTIGNRGYMSAAGTGRATVAGTADFESLTVVVPVWTSGTASLLFRFTDTNNYLRWGGTVGSAPAFVAVVGGATTRTEQVSSISHNVLAANDTLGVRCNGSVIELFVNDLLLLTVTETDNQDATRVGMYTTSTVPRFNNFTFNSTVSPQTFTVTRGVNGTATAHPAGTEVVLYQRPYRGL